MDPRLDETLCGADNDDSSGQVGVIGGQLCTLPPISEPQHRLWCELLRAVDNVESTRTKIDDHAAELGLDDSMPIQTMIEDVDLLRKEILVLGHATKHLVRMGGLSVHAAQLGDLDARIVGEWFNDLFHAREEREMGKRLMGAKIVKLNSERLRHALGHARYAVRQAEQHNSERSRVDARACIDVVRHLRLYPGENDDGQTPLWEEMNIMNEALIRLTPLRNEDEHHISQGATDTSLSVEAGGYGSKDEGESSRANKRIKLDSNSGFQGCDDTGAARGERGGRGA